jgi:hypothetical protein
MAEPRRPGGTGRQSLSGNWTPTINPSRQTTRQCRRAPPLGVSNSVKVSGSSYSSFKVSRAPECDVSEIEHAIGGCSLSMNILALLMKMLSRIFAKFGAIAVIADDDHRESPLAPAHRRPSGTVGNSVQRGH